MASRRIVVRAEKGGLLSTCGQAAGLAGPAAFTLIELLIVVTIMAILAAVALPSWGNSEVARLRAAAQTLAGDIQYVQSMAISNGEPLRIEFLTNQNRYQVVDPDGGDQGQPVVIDYPISDYPAHDDQFIVDFDDPGPMRGVVIGSAQFGAGSVLEFGRYGEPTVGGEVVLQTKRFRVRVRVAAVSGQVTIGDLEGQPG